MEATRVLQWEKRDLRTDYLQPRRRVRLWLSVFLAAALALFITRLGRAEEDPESEPFLRDAAVVGMTEVELGKLAVARGRSSEVTAFGQRMVADHGKANEDLKALAAKRRITLPAELDTEHKVHKDRLSAIAGGAFDKAYIDDMVNGHDEVVEKFRKASTSLDTDVAAFATRMLPTLQEHLTEARRIQSTLMAGAQKTSRAH